LVVKQVVRFFRLKPALALQNRVFLMVVVQKLKCLNNSSKKKRPKPADSGRKAPPFYLACRLLLSAPFSVIFIREAVPKGEKPHENCDIGGDNGGHGGGAANGAEF
jgi:hypothetical protein